MVLSTNIPDVFDLGNRVFLAVLVGGVGAFTLKRFSTHALRWKKVLLWMLLISQMSLVVALYFIMQTQLRSQSVLSSLGAGLHPFVTGIVWRYMQGIVVGWFLAASLGVLSWYLFLKRGRGSLLDADDIFLLLIGTAAIGWPGVFVFLALLFALSILFMLGLVLLRKKSLSDRLVITPYIIPTAIITLIFQTELLVFTHLYVIRF